MFPRVLFLLLLALNIGGAFWIAFAPDASVPAPAITDPGVPALVLLSERDGARAGANPTKPVDAAAAAASSSDVCASIGPFQTQSDMRASLNSLTPLVKRIQYRDERATQSRGFWVFLAAMKTREDALGVARRLSAKGVRDYYVVTAGDQENTISLGLFRESENAARRRDEVKALGLDARLEERAEDTPEYWLDYAVNPERRFDWRDRVPDRMELKARDLPCGELR